MPGDMSVVKFTHHGLEFCKALGMRPSKGGKRKTKKDYADRRARFYAAAGSAAQLASAAGVSAVAARSRATLPSVRPVEPSACHYDLRKRTLQAV